MNCGKAEQSNLKKKIKSKKNIRRPAFLIEDKAFCARFSYYFNYSNDLGRGKIHRQDK